jgi:hypothetical protein
MRPLLRKLFGILMGILLALMILLAAALVQKTVQEDSLLWDCYLMGNHQCGNVDQVAGFIMGRK